MNARLVTRLSGQDRQGDAVASAGTGENEMRAFAAYKRVDDWMPLSSIRLSQSGVREWMKQMYLSPYISYSKEWQIVPVEVRKIRTKTKRRTVKTK